MAGKGYYYPLLDTPAVLVDMDRLEANIKDMSERAKSAGVRLRPHVKVHECAEIAKMQLAAGACGIDTGSLGPHFPSDILRGRPARKIQKAAGKRRPEAVSQPGHGGASGGRFTGGKNCR
jgi:hypothetical protein